MNHTRACINLDGVAPTLETVSLRALWVMMTAWGAREARQERYRAHMSPRWPSVTVLIDHVAE